MMPARAKILSFQQRLIDAWQPAGLTAVIEPNGATVLHCPACASERISALEIDERFVSCSYRLCEFSPRGGVDEIIAEAREYLEIPAPAVLAIVHSVPVAAPLPLRDPKLPDVVTEGQCVAVFVPASDEPKETPGKDEQKSKPPVSPSRRGRGAVGLHGNHRRRESGFWSWVSHTALARAVEAGGSGGGIVYVALCQLESQAPIAHKAAFKASANNIAAACGISSRTVKRLLPVLIRARLISMQCGRHSGQNFAHEANTFRLLEMSQAPCEISVARDGPHKRDSSREAGKKKLGGPLPSGRPTGSAGASRVKKGGI